MPIAPNLIRVAEIVMRGVIGAGGGDSVKTNFVFHYRRTAVAVNANKAALEGAFNTAIAVPIAAALNERWEASLHDVRWVDDAEDPYTSIAATELGLIVGDSLSSFEAAYLLTRTALRGRFYRGSKHFSPLSESDVGDDVWNAGCLTRLNTIATAMATPLVDSTTNTWNLCVLSRTKSQLKFNPTTVVANDVTQVIVRSNIGTMNSRKIRSIY
jgi:hypothetical protein